MSHVEGEYNQFHVEQSGPTNLPNQSEVQGEFSFKEKGLALVSLLKEVLPPKAFRALALTAALSVGAMDVLSHLIPEGSSVRKSKAEVVKEYEARHLPEAVKEDIAFIEQAVGPQVLQDMRKLDSILDVSTREDFLDHGAQALPEELRALQNPIKLAVSSLEKLKPPTPVKYDSLDHFRLDNQDMSTLVQESLPEGFRYNLKSVAYVDVSLLLPTAYGMPGSEYIAGTVGREGKIYFYKKANRVPTMDIVKTYLPHEVGHSNDWGANRLLTYPERVQLLANTVRRVRSPNRHKSNYVEAIHNKDPKVQLLNRATEYYADTTAMGTSEEYWLLPEEDKKWVDKLFKKMDPRFTRERARGAQRAVIDSVIDKQFDKAYVRMPNGDFMPKADYDDMRANSVTVYAHKSRKGQRKK